MIPAERKIKPQQNVRQFAYLEFIFELKCLKFDYKFIEMCFVPGNPNNGEPAFGLWHGFE